MDEPDTANKLLKALTNNYNTSMSLEVRNFCKPLFEAFDLNYFDYTRYYPNNTCHVFISDFEYAVFFTSYKEYRNRKGYDVPTKMLSPGKHLWQSSICSHFLNEAGENFRHGIGLTFVKTNEEFTELYNFAAPPNYTHVLDLFMNHDYILETFCVCFKEHFSDCFKKQNNRIILPENSTAKSNEIFKDNNLFKKLDEMLRALIKVRKNNILIQANNKLVSLSQQEINCLLLLARGKSTKEIAREINISPKTADIHCNNLLKKTDCTSRIEMLYKFSQNFINDMIAINT